MTSDDERLPARYPRWPFVRRAGRVYPAVALPVPAVASPDDLVEVTTEPLGPDARLREAGAAHLEGILAAHPRTFDGRVLAMVRMPTGSVSTGPLVAAPAGYFDMLATCDALAAEWARGPGPTPLRDRADALAGDPVTNGAGRAAAIGVSVAVTVTHEQVQHVLMGRRTTSVATDPGRWHIAPSGMVEPSSGLTPLVSAMLRELAEETGITAPPAPSLLGIGVDMLRLRPEICLHVAAVEAPALLSTDEFDRRALVPVGGLRMWRRFPPERLTPAAAATLALLEGDGG